MSAIVYDDDDDDDDDDNNNSLGNCPHKYSKVAA